MNNKKDSYSSDNILVLDDILAIRKYPGMYIGNISDGSHLFNEVLNNSVDEYLMGYGKKITITIVDSSTISIEDMGRGIPIERHKLGMRTVELVLTKNHSGGKFNTEVYNKSGGLHGVGLVAVNALSSEMVVEIKRKDGCCSMHLEKGVIISQEYTDQKNKETGTKITFTPDKTIFDSIETNYNKILDNIKDIAAINTDLVIVYINNITNTQETFHVTEGISYLIQQKIVKPLIVEAVYVAAPSIKTDVIAFFNWDTDSKDEYIKAFTNCILQPEGGAHVTGTKSAILKFLNEIKEIAEFNKPLTWGDIKSGFRLVIHVRAQSPKFNAQSKAKLISADIRKYVEDHTYKALKNKYKNAAYMFKHLVDVAIRSLTAKSMKESNGSHLSALMYDGNLCDAMTSQRDLAELYIVEGMSAGGNVKPEVDKNTQGVFTLRGKILNVEKANVSDILGSEMIGNIISAFGGKYDSYGNVYIDEFRYGKAIILVDADVDGSHIKTLLLALFYNHLQEYIADGRLYVAVPPLYRAQVKHDSIYFNDKQELLNFIFQLAVDKYLSKYKIVENSQVLKSLFTLIYDSQKQLSSFSILIIFQMLQLKIRSMDHLLAQYNEFSALIKESSSIYDVYINNNSEVVIENYMTLSKIIINKSFIGLYKKFVAIYKIEKTNVQISYDVIMQLYDALYKLMSDCMVQRFKGLGEMNRCQTYYTVINKNTRILKQITMTDGEKAGEICKILMGTDSKHRQKFILDYYGAETNPSEGGI